MPCGCSQTQTNTGPGQHVYIDSQGNKTTYPSKTQAKAAQIRAGGTGTVKPR